MDATVALLCVEEITAVCLYLHIAGSLKILLGSWKSPEIYFGQDSGNPDNSVVTFPLYLCEVLYSVLSSNFCHCLHMDDLESCWIGTCFVKQLTGTSLVIVFGVHFKMPGA